MTQSRQTQRRQKRESVGAASAHPEAKLRSSEPVESTARCVQCVARSNTLSASVIKKRERREANARLAEEEVEDDAKALAVSSESVRSSPSSPPASAASGPSSSERRAANALPVCDAEEGLGGQHCCCALAVECGWRARASATVRPVGATACDDGGSWDARRALATRAEDGAALAAAAAAVAEGGSWLSRAVGTAPVRVSSTAAAWGRRRRWRRRRCWGRP
jgi:hypothetical protein